VNLSRSFTSNIAAFIQKKGGCIIAAARNHGKMVISFC